MKRLTVPAYEWRKTKAMARYINSTKAKDPWVGGTKLTKEFKANVTANLLVEQAKRCAYCGGRLFEKRPHRDHIAPKEKYKKWMFWPENIVLACFACNTDLKASFDPVVKVGVNYRATEFSIVHPYLDDPAEHIGYAADGLSVLIGPVNNSEKGLRTIRLFELSDPERAKQRAKDVLFDADASVLYGNLRTLFDAAAEQIESQRLRMRLV
jgi:uncharacterized protein (TIGR02646 family)